MARRTAVIPNQEQAIQLPLFADARTEQRDDEVAIARHTRDSTASILVRRIECAAQRNSRVMVDLRGDITQFATSAQVLDLILAERTVETDVNQVRTFRGLRPISLGYLLPDDRLARASSGLADVGRLGAQNFLHGLDDRQRALLMKIARPNSIPIHPVTDESPEVGDVTLLPVERVGSAPGALTPLVAQVHERLEKLLRRGMPGVDDTYVTRLLTFFEETAANVRQLKQPCHAPQRLKRVIVSNRS